MGKEATIKGEQKEKIFTLLLDLDQVDDLNWELHKQDAFIYAISTLSEDDEHQRLGTLTSLLWEIHDKIKNILVFEKLK